jgi:hypothetical protein
MNIPNSLLTQRLNSYSPEADERKQQFLKDGKKFLKALAQEIGVADQCDLRVNEGGMAVSGEVTLHADSLYIQLFESGKPGVRALYRTCEGRKDYTGGRNLYVTMKELHDNPQDLADFLELCSDIAKSGVTA